MANFPADINLDGVVDVSDLLALLAAWGPQDACHLANFNGDTVVDVSDLLALLAAWGTCPGYPNTIGQPSTIADLMDEAGLTMEAWDAFVSVMTGEDEKEKENWKCWMENCLMLCVNCPTCPGPDPI